jgi:hypothetical protein
MSKQPYRRGIRVEPRPRSRVEHDAGRLDPMAIWTMVFVLGCALFRVWVMVRGRAIDVDGLIATAATLLSGRWLIRTWLRRGA